MAAKQEKKENKAAAPAEDKAAETKAVQVLAPFTGAITAADCEKNFPGKGRQVFRDLAQAGRYGLISPDSNQPLALPKTEEGYEDMLVAMRGIVTAAGETK